MDRRKTFDLKKNIAALIVSTGLLLFPTMNLHADESNIRNPEISCAGQDHNICRVEVTVNVRTSPSMQSQVVRQLRQGEVVKTGALNNYWYSIFKPNRNADNDADAIGYVYAPLLKPVREAISRQAQVPVFQSPRMTITCAGQNHNICKVDRTVNVRKSPTTQSQITRKLRKGDTVKTGTLKNDWYSVFSVDQNADNDADAIGYVYAPLLKPAKKMIAEKTPEPADDEPADDEPADDEPETPAITDPKASIDALKKKIAYLEEEVLYMGERIDDAELHTATDRISFDFEFRTRVDSIHYTNIRRAPEWFLDSFTKDGSEFGESYKRPENASLKTLEGVKKLWDSLKYANNYLAKARNISVMEVILSINGFGFNGLPTDFAKNLRRAMQEGGHTPDSETYNVDDSTIWTNKFFMNMKAKISSNLSFTGRLAMYKVFGDSSGLKVNNGSFGDIFLDSNTSSLPHGDSIRLERAYFNYKSTIGSLPVNFSLGRRPATMGPPLEYANNSLEGGSPLASLVNMQFDGLSLNFSLEEATQITGAAFKLCYGVGFESGFGNSYSLAHDSDTVRDATFGGFIATLYNDDTTSLILNYAHAWNLTDGFTGTMLLPFLVKQTNEPVYDANNDRQIGTESVTQIEKNAADLISRMEANTNIGDVDMLGLLLRTNLSAINDDLDIDLFLALSWSHTDPTDL